MPKSVPISSFKLFFNSMSKFLNEILSLKCDYIKVNHLNIAMCPFYNNLLKKSMNFSH